MITPDQLRARYQRTRSRDEKIFARDRE